MADVNAGKSRYAANPLMAAIQGQNVQVVVTLLDHGANVGANDCHFTNTLQAAAARKCSSLRGNY